MDAPHGAGGSWSDLITTQAKFAVWNLQVACRWMDAFNPAQIKLVTLTLPANVWQAKDHLEAHQKEKKQFFQLQNEQDEAEAISTMVQIAVDADPTHLLQELANGLLTAVYDWKNPDRWARKLRREAGAALVSIGDVQLVVESILSDEWGSRSDSLRSIKPYRIGADDEMLSPKKPPQSVPIRSLGPLGEPGHAWSENAGLRRWPGTKPDDRGTWEFVTLDYGVDPAARAIQAKPDNE